MKKSIILAAGLMLTIGAFAQTTPRQEDKKEDSKALRDDIKEKRKDNKEVAKDVTHLKLKEAKKEHREVVADKKAMHRDAKHLKKEHGVKHPIRRAKHQIHEQHEANESAKELKKD